MRLSESCFAVTGLGYSTPWCVNAGFITGDGATLVVDTGANSLAAATIYGYALAARPANSLRAINTEKHFDHIGGNSFFKSKQVEIWGHVELVRTDSEFADEVQEFNAGITNPMRRARQEASAFFTGTTLALPDHKITSDQTMILGNYPIEILLTPGHTRTNLSVWVPADRVLYCGDCLIDAYLPNLDAGCREDWTVWLGSLNRVEALEPEVIVAGHGPVAFRSDVPRVIKNVRQTLLKAIESKQSPTAFRAIP